MLSLLANFKSDAVNLRDRISLKIIVVVSIVIALVWLIGSLVAAAFTGWVAWFIDEGDSGLMPKSSSPNNTPLSF